MVLTNKENEIKLMGNWVAKMDGLLRESELVLEICGAGWKKDPLENARAMYENGWRLVSTFAGYALKRVA